MRALRRYQCNKTVLQILRAKHPWIFRSHLSTAAETFKSGDWLKLVDAENRVVGTGLYDSESLIAIRVIGFGAKTIDTKFISERLDRCLAKRTPLRNYTDAFRLIHGDNEGFPGIVIDVYGDHLILQTYSPAVDHLGRYVAALAAKKLKSKSILWKRPTRRRAKGLAEATRRLRGKAPEIVSFHEAKRKLAVALTEGQKSGVFLDLRALRKWIAAQKLLGKKVLNLFSYTGTLGQSAEAAGASEIWNVDASQGALDFGKKYHELGKAKVRWVKADIFEWLRDEKGKNYDLVIVDPPSMASEMNQIPQVLKTYRKLFSQAASLTSPKALLITCCCTSRVRRDQFEKLTRDVLARDFSAVANLSAEDDHPVGFPEGDYLKILIWKRKA